MSLKTDLKHPLAWLLGFVLLSRQHSQVALMVTTTGKPKRPPILGRGLFIHLTLLYYRSMEPQRQMSTRSGLTVAMAPL